MSSFARWVIKRVKEALEVGSVLALIAWQKFLEPLLAGGVSVSGVGWEAVVKEMLSLEQEVILVG